MLMLLVLVFGCWLGWYVRSVREQRSAVEAIKRAGGVVDYDWDWTDYNPDILDYSGRHRPPKWLSRRIGVDFVANVVSVALRPRGGGLARSADDETLKRLGGLRHMEHLLIRHTAITDGGLVHLRGLKRLRQLDLSYTQIGDAGLAHLRALTALRSLDIVGTRVTDAAVLALEKAIPGVRVGVEGDGLDITLCRRALSDLEFARSQPIRIACGLLRDRATMLAGRNDPAEFVATVDAICDLEANDILSLMRLIAACAQCVGVLESCQPVGMTASERLILQRRCRARGIAALSRAIDLGYDDVRRLDAGSFSGAWFFWNLRDDPAYSTLIAKVRAKQRGR
jgi:hypothetical protein